jgi:hypothetical protein
MFKRHYLGQVFVGFTCVEREEDGGGLEPHHAAEGLVEVALRGMYHI